MQKQSLEKELGISREGLVIKGSRIFPLALAGLAVLVFLAKGIDWTNSDFIEHDPSVLASDGGDVANLPKLLARLQSQDEGDRISRYLWPQFSPKTKEALGSPLSPVELQKRLLSEELNKVIKSGYSIYSTLLFPSDLENFALIVNLETPENVKHGDSGSVFAPNEWLSDMTLSCDHEPVVIAERNKDKKWRFKVTGEKKWRSCIGAGSLLNVYHEVDLAYRNVEFDRIKKRLEASADLPAAEKTALARDIVATLGYTGLGFEIDELNAKIAKGKDVSGTDRMELNRRLLQYAYPDEIRKKRWSWQKSEPSGAASAGATSRSISKLLVEEIPLFIKYQIVTAWTLALFALVPGFAGLVYRRAFWHWFLGGFLALFLVNLIAARLGWGEVGAALKSKLGFWYDVFLWIEMLAVLLALAFALRRHSLAGIEARARHKAILWAAVLTLSAIAWVWQMWSRDHFGLGTLGLAEIGGIAFLLLAAWAIISQSLRADPDRGMSGKNIVVCLDGTWNQPGTKDYGYLAETNVFKLFKMLKGTRVGGTYNANECKEYLNDRQFRMQVGFYYHGVGNSAENSQLGQLLGGAFGMGAEAIVERAYLDVATVYRPGDRIFIFGFSRGAALARLLAGVIGRRDIPRSLWTLRLFGRHWLVWKSSRKVNESEPATVDVLGCWDTVGAFGISKNILGIPFQKVNLLKDLNVSLCVKRAYHMLALDETRDSFEPTLMDPDPTTPDRVVEVWFSGNHSNVGGGYATDKLSDVTLDFLLRQVSSGYAWKDNMEPGNDESWGLYLSAAKKGNAHTGDDKTMMVDPDPRGQLRYATGPLYSHAPRQLPIRAIVHDSVFERMACALPIYTPQSLFQLNEKLDRIRRETARDVQGLLQTQSLDESASKKILAWGSEKLSILKWSTYQQAHSPRAGNAADDGNLEVKKSLRPADQELANHITRRGNPALNAAAA